MRGNGIRQGSGVLGVIGASGGVGASVLAAAVAQRGAQAGVHSVLVDGCELGGGLDITMGLEQEPGLRWGDLAGLSGAADGRALLARLPVADGVPVLSHGRRSGPAISTDVVLSVVEALRHTAELVVVDLPTTATPGLGDLVDRLLVVGGTQLRQLAALCRFTSALQSSTHGPIAVCLRGDPLGPDIRRVVEGDLGMTTLAEVGHDRGLEADLLHGVPPGTRRAGPVVAAADEVLAWALGRSEVQVA